MKTYKEAFDLLTQAYINLEVNPFLNCNCFVGNLLGTLSWSSYRSCTHIMDNDKSLEECLRFISSAHDIIDGYEVIEIIEMERTFLLTYVENNGGVAHYLKNYDDYRILALGYCRGLSYDICILRQEEALFKAFEAALENLKQIHIRKGEDVDSQFIFKKRQLV